MLAAAMLGALGDLEAPPLAPPPSESRSSSTAGRAGRAGGCAGLGLIPGLARTPASSTSNDIREEVLRGESPLPPPLPFTAA